jgi:hypothetical protein
MRCIIHNPDLGVLFMMGLPGRKAGLRCRNIVLHTVYSNIVAISGHSRERHGCGGLECSQL